MIRVAAPIGLLAPRKSHFEQERGFLPAELVKTPFSANRTSALIRH